MGTWDRLSVSFTWLYSHSMLMCTGISFIWNEGAEKKQWCRHTSVSVWRCCTPVLHYMYVIFTHTSIYACATMHRKKHFFCIFYSHIHWLTYTEWSGHALLHIIKMRSCASVLFNFSSQRNNKQFFIELEEQTKLFKRKLDMIYFLMDIWGPHNYQDCKTIKDYGWQKSINFLMMHENEDSLTCSLIHYFLYSNTKQSIDNWV